MTANPMADAIGADEFWGFEHNPTKLLIEQYQHIAQQEMANLPFYRAEMPIKVEMQEYEGQWLGTVLTPWMLSVVILPGPDQVWPRRALGERIALSLPRGDMTFMVGELPQTGQLLSCSLMSPIESHISATEGEALASDTLKMLLSLPVQDQATPVSVSRRELLMRKR